MKTTITLIVALLIAPAYADDRAKTTDTAKSADAAKLSRDDLQVLAHYHALNLREIDLGKYVMKTSENAQVKEYAQMLIEDHGDADKKLLALAKARGAKIPKVKPRIDAERVEIQATKQQVARIKRLEGSGLDMQYITAMVNGHEKELAKVDLKAAEAQDPEVKQMALGKKATLQKHADHAREIQKTLTQPTTASTTTTTPSTTARR